MHPSKCSVIVTFLATEFDRYPAMTFSLFGDKFTRAVPEEETGWASDGAPLK